MCIICVSKEDYSQLSNLTTLDCFNCPLLKIIPKELVNLTSLYCFNCPLLNSLPNCLVNLTSLYCSYCPLLTSIPKELVNLTTLACSCPLLTSIPKELVALTRLYCSNCPLLTNIPKELVNLTHLDYENCILYIPNKIKEKTKKRNNNYLGLCRIKCINKLKRIRVKMLFNNINSYNVLIPDVNHVIVNFII